MKILLVADEASDYIWTYYNPKHFETVDLILAAGDLKASYLEFLTTILRKPLYYVHGNHDTSYLNQPPGGCINIDDQLIVVKGVRILGLGGSRRYKEGPFQYTEEEMFGRVYKLRHKLTKLGGFDILLTHAPSAGMGDGSDVCHQGFGIFNQLIHVYQPSYFLHGHQHLNYSSNTKRTIHYQQTTIINGFGYHLFDYIPNSVATQNFSSKEMGFSFIRYLRQKVFNTSQVGH